MSASQYRGQLDRTRKQRVEAEKKAGDYRTKETQKRTAASSARTAAWKSNSRVVPHRAPCEPGIGFLPVSTLRASSTRGCRCRCCYASVNPRHSVRLLVLP